jgi:transcriptional regulator with XRE-family HTH domain
MTPHPTVRTLFNQAARNFLSLMDLARLSNTHHSILTRWRNGETTPRVTTLDRLNEIVKQRREELKRTPRLKAEYREAYEVAKTYEAAAAKRPASVEKRRTLARKRAAVRR